MTSSINTLLWINDVIHRTKLVVMKKIIGSEFPNYLEFGITNLTCCAKGGVGLNGKATRV